MPDIQSEKSWLEKYIKYIVSIYLGFILIYTVIFIFSDGENQLLSSNELGDFLAGSFVPLAFLLLYLGYMQQTKVIEKNNQLMIKTNQPKFELTSFKSKNDLNRLNISFIIKNHGQSCKYLDMKILNNTDKNSITCISRGFHHLTKLNPLKQTITINEPSAIAYKSISLALIYTNIFGQHEYAFFQIIDFTSEIINTQKLPLHLEPKYRAQLGSQ